MPEVFPNWHPAIVHFPIALTVTATLLLLAGRLSPGNRQLTASGRLLLPLAALSALLAVALGWQAYSTVEHDAAGHLVMLRHRNWAMSATLALVALAVWDALRQRAEKEISAALLPALLILSGSLGVTGWLGGEMVYRHGIGVSAAAFSSPVVPPPPAMATEPLPAAPAAVPETRPAAAHVEHVHRDGQRHRH